MTLTELRYIVSVARERHFGRAAQACFISQPTLSVSVQKLEAELGILLFERGRPEVSVTPIGERIVDQAAQVLEEAGVIMSLAEQGKNPLSGRFRLGIIYTVGPYLLPHLVRKLPAVAPDMPLIIEENYTHVLADKLRRGEVDAIIVSAPFSQQYVYTWEVYEEPFVVMLPAQHDLASREAITVRELAKENVLLLGEGNCFRDQVIKVCPGCATGGGILQRVETSRLETICYMVASGLGVTILPASAVRPGFGGEGLVVTRPFLRNKVPTRKVVLAWRNSFSRPEAIDALRRAVLACEIPGVSLASADKNPSGG